MADKTKIEWADATLNYVNGCSLHSPGCTNCYAMKQAHRFPVRQGLTVQSKGGMVWTGEVRENPKALEQALRWQKPRAIFWNAHGDLFHESVPDEWIDKQFAIMALTPHHKHMILTKRSDRMRRYMLEMAAGKRPISHTACGFLPDRDYGEVFDHIHFTFWPDSIHKYRSKGRKLPEMFKPIPNVWLGVSAENQEWANKRIPDLLATPAAHRFVSCEPLLGPINLYDAMWAGKDWRENLFASIDWIIAGGESGPKARPMHPDWARKLRDQCAENGTSFNFKQNGEWVSVSDVEGSGKHYHFPDGTTVRKVGKRAAGRLLDGVTHDGDGTYEGEYV